MHALEAINEGAEASPRIIRGSAGALRVGYPTDGLGQRLSGTRALAWPRFDPPRQVHPCR